MKKTKHITTITGYCDHTGCNVRNQYYTIWDVLLPSGRRLYCTLTVSRILPYVALPVEREAGLSNATGSKLRQASCIESKGVDRSQIECVVY